jgi:hypothetical protein
VTHKEETPEMEIERNFGDTLDFCRSAPPADIGRLPETGQPVRPVKAAARSPIIIDLRIERS